MRPLELKVEGPDQTTATNEMNNQIQNPTLSEPRISQENNNQNEQPPIASPVKRGSISNGPGALGLPKIPSLLITPYQSLNLLNEEILEEPEGPPD